MERNLYLELCQRQAMKGGVMVEYVGIQFHPYAYELMFDSVGNTKHTAILKDTKANSFVYCDLQDVK